jgi:hypothetical protein
MAVAFQPHVLLESTLAAGARKKASRGVANSFRVVRQQSNTQNQGWALLKSIDIKSTRITHAH